MATSLLVFTILCALLLSCQHALLVHSKTVTGSVQLEAVSWICFCFFIVAKILSWITCNTEAEVMYVSTMMTTYHTSLRTLMCMTLSPLILIY